MERIGFVNGWGIGEREALEAFARSGWPDPVCVQTPSPGWYERLCHCELDTVVAYSTGAFLLLNEFAPPRWRRMVFLAPFRSLVLESGLGGRVRLAQLRYVSRWLQRDALAAVNDFRARAGVGEALEWIPVAENELAWGIEMLATTIATGHVDERARLVVGEKDPLLDPAALGRDWPKLKTLPGVGHGLEELLVGARREVLDAV